MNCANVKVCPCGGAAGGVVCAAAVVAQSNAAGTNAVIFFMTPPVVWVSSSGAAAEPGPSMQPDARPMQRTRGMLIDEPCIRPHRFIIAAEMR
jgi:hypothetical protein